MTELTRRDLMRSGALAAGALAVGPAFLREALAAPAQAGASPYGPLGTPDANGLMLPRGFRSRQIARGLQNVRGTAYNWPVFSDGQAVFRTGDGGWILVTNSESLAFTGAGTSAIRFRPDGSIQSAYRILGGTNANCAGGPTPWGTWLSCEETDNGLVWECDPAGVLDAEPRPALGVFNHEAAVVDPIGGHVYLTEDESDGGFYRFTSDAYPNLDAGRLEVAAVASDGSVSWLAVPDPTRANSDVPTRDQVAGMTQFRSGEGIWYSQGVLYFTTKGDKKVWAYDAVRNRIEVIFDRQAAQDSSLDAVDNVTVAPSGDILVCEDGGNMEIGLITPERTVSPLLRFVGSAHEGSEVCGVVFDPSGTRMYCTSQRAYPIAGPLAPGAVYEITGPFRIPAGGVPPDLVYGPPAGELRPNGPLNPGVDSTAPTVAIATRGRIRRGVFTRRGLPVTIEVGEAASLAVALESFDLVRRPGKGGSSARPKPVGLARKKLRLERGETSVELRLRPGRNARRRLRKRRRSLGARIMVSAVDAAGNEQVATKRIVVGPRPRRRSRRPRARRAR